MWRNKTLKKNVSWTCLERDVYEPGAILVQKKVQDMYVIER